MQLGPGRLERRAEVPGYIAYRRIEASLNPPEPLSHGSEPVLEGHQIDVQDHHVSNERLEADNAPDPSKFGLGLFRTGPCESTRGWVCRRKVGTRT